MKALNKLLFRIYLQNLFQLITQRCLNQYSNEYYFKITEDKFIDAVELAMTKYNQLESEAGNG